MIKPDEYINKLLTLLSDQFNERLLYVGLQGSYLRNEANENSDIDIMVIIDDITVHDLTVYKNALISVGQYEKSCGFICGKSEMANWNPLEICQLLHTTKNLYGKLMDFVPAYTIEDEKNYIKLSLGNLYHELCHRYVHSDPENNRTHLPLAYKSAFFIIQNINYINSGTFIATKCELVECLNGLDKKIIEMLIKLRDDKEYNFNQAFDLLFTWCQKAIITM
ncbi:MAG: nucleotidyltransferase domain-containing protein [Clostridiaceae bacterium]|nr:nucleotidyltransferase domain-containing protein [Clostridiaceae bacterium]